MINRYRLIFLCCLQGLLASGQTAAPIRNLVFEGAGIRGLAYSGAIAELEKADLLAGIHRVGGTSAGAVTALLLSLGYTSGEISDIVQSTSYRKFNDGRYFFIGGINRLKKYFGWYRGQQFDKWLTRLIEVKTGNAAITFEELHHFGFKDLYVTGTCLNRQKMVVFSSEHYPKMKIKDAIRISVTIPFYFEPVYIDHDGKLFWRPAKKEGLDIMIDGGVVANFPIRLFDSTKYQQAAQANEYHSNPETLGFRIDREEQIANDHAGNGLADMPVNNLDTYVTAFYTLVIEQMNRQQLTKEDWTRTVSISDGTIAPRIRKLSADEVQLLMKNGSVATKIYLVKKQEKDE